MFEVDTVFVLGAGASWHYGYPTGEQLVLDVIEMAKRLETECRSRLQGSYILEVPRFVSTQSASAKREFWSNLQKGCAEIIGRLETVQPLVIDYFLGWNPTLRDVGKLLIAGVILSFEAAYARERGNINRRLAAERATTALSAEDLKRLNITAYKDNWYRFVTHKLVSKCETSSDLLANKVRFITFNYDFSLESHLLKALSAIDLFEERHIKEFVSPERFLHVYGCVRSDDVSNNDLKANGFFNGTLAGWFALADGTSDGRWLKFLENCEQASRNIRTIDGDDKEHRPSLEVAKRWVKGSEILYILGYGFDATNSERIGLGAISNPNTSRRVFFTNFQDANSVNKRVGELAGNYRHFIDRSSVGLGMSTFEKSVRDVYGALELDFGMY